MIYVYLYLVHFVFKFCEVINKDHQYSVYQQLSSRQLTNKEKINTFEDYGKT